MKNPDVVSDALEFYSHLCQILTAFVEQDVYTYPEVTWTVFELRVDSIVYLIDLQLMIYITEYVTNLCFLDAEQ